MMAVEVVADVSEDFQVLRRVILHITRLVEVVPADTAATVETAAATKMARWAMAGEFMNRLLQAAAVVVAVATAQS
jgi:hypothetical protein